jgi:hypothetical protein
MRNSCVSAVTAGPLQLKQLLLVAPNFDNGADLIVAQLQPDAVHYIANGGTGTITYSKDNGANFQASNISKPIKLK